MTHTEWAESVKETMNARGLSVQEIAFLLRKSQEHIYKNISGRRPTQKGINEISKFLGIKGYEVKK